MWDFLAFSFCGVVLLGCIFVLGVLTHASQDKRSSSLVTLLIALPQDFGSRSFLQRCVAVSNPCVFCRFMCYVGPIIALVGLALVISRTIEHLPALVMIRIFVMLMMALSAIGPILCCTSESQSESDANKTWAQRSRSPPGTTVLVLTISSTT